MPEMDVEQWKGVAEVLKFSVRQVQRFHREAGLPVYECMGRIVANRAELLEWRAKQTRPLSLPVAS